MNILPLLRFLDFLHGIIYYSLPGDKAQKQLTHDIRAQPGSNQQFLTPLDMVKTIVKLV